jgi:hypothetical protein
MISTLKAISKQPSIDTARQQFSRDRASNIWGKMSRVVGEKGRRFSPPRMIVVARFAASCETDGKTAPPDRIGSVRDGRNAGPTAMWVIVS